MSVSGANCHSTRSASAANLNRNEFHGRFNALDGLIDRFIASLPPVERSGNPDAILTSLVTHTMARAATIQLRSNFRGQDRMNDRKDLAAAQAAAGLLDNLNLVPTNVDPILAVRTPLNDNRTSSHIPCVIRYCGRR